MSTTATHCRIPPLALTVPEVAEVLGISRSLAYQLVAAGQLPHLRLGRSLSWGCGSAGTDVVWSVA